MKQILFAILLSTVATGCCHKAPGDSMTVIRDCSGSYLRFEGKDYQVCNRTITDPYADGASVRARFKRIPACTEEHADCKLYHPNEGWIQVESIR